MKDDWTSLHQYKTHKDVCVWPQARRERNQKWQGARVKKICEYTMELHECNEFVRFTV
jgi:hypothetical protein